MLEYIYVAVVVIVVIAIAVAAGVMVSRKRAGADFEGMTYAQPAESEPVSVPVAPVAPGVIPPDPDPWMERPVEGYSPTESQSEAYLDGSHAVPETAPAPSFARAAPEPAPALVAAPVGAAMVSHNGYAVNDSYAAGDSHASGNGSTGVARGDPGEGPDVRVAAAYAGSGAAGVSQAAGNQMPAPGLLTDPLGAVILRMAEGRGRLAGPELKRLDVFRPERVEFAVDTLQLPPELANDGDVLMRLAQIKLYASTLLLRAKWSSQLTRGAGSPLPDRPLSAQELKLKMARDIMALPAADRADVIGYLLGGLLSSDGSLELKKAVIDTLEHLQSAALVNVLLDCLDDPDPIVQEYALAAADRLLEGR